MTAASDAVATRRVDAVVVGSGISGAAAAMTAARRGARVALVEKLGRTGGSAALSVGMFWTAPSIEAYRRRIPHGDPDLARAVIEDYPGAVAEIRGLGVRVADRPTHGIMTFGVGYSIDVRDLLRRCQDEVVRAGGSVVTGATVVELLSGQGRVVGGVLVREASGRLTRYEAPGTVVATGGFQGAPEMLERYIGPNAGRLVLRSNPGSVGDGLRLAQSVGAGSTFGMSTFYGHLLPYPLRRFTPDDYTPLTQYYSDAGVLVNLRGERFCDETQGDEILNQALAVEAEARGVLIFDEHVRRTRAVEEAFPGLGAIDRVAIAAEAGGRVARAATLGELVEAIASWGVEARALSTTLEEYTAAAQAGGGFSGGVGVAASARPPATGPFYALMVQPSVTFTLGGIPVSTRGEVLDHDRRPVAGLYACGSDIGGFSNHGYAGGLAPGYITGRWAGESAAAASLAK